MISHDSRETTRHERRTLKRAFFATGYPHANKMNPCALQFLSHVAVCR